MLTITVDHDAQAAPIYRQIADGLREHIARGRLSGGAELPSVRSLGAQLAVNQNTVARAYRMLADEGLVELRQGASVRVRSAREPSPGRRPGSDAQERRLRELISHWVLAGADRRSVERVVARTLDDFFGKAPRPGGAT